MCTSATYKTKDAYFGRNLDNEFSYGEEAVIIPRNFPLDFREVGRLDQHHAIIGISYIVDNYPLLYDAINEKGLGIAGLNFVGNAVYNEHVEGKDNIAQFEFLPWILSQCSTIAEVKALLAKINLRNFPFNAQLTPAELHWHIYDGNEAIVVESVADGLKIYDNPLGILTNNPPFPSHLLNLSNYQHLSAKAPENHFFPDYNFPIYSRGMGAIGLPGDLSSESRFIKAAFTKLNSVSADDEISSVNQYFHILHSVDQQNGCCDLGDGKYERTLYSSCYNLNQGIFYYTTYNNHQISAIKMHSTDLDSTELIRFPVIDQEQIHYQN